MLQQPAADDYVIATGETHSIRDLLDVAFATSASTTGSTYVQQDPRFMRPAEVDLLIGDADQGARRARLEAQVAFPDLVAMMVDADLAEQKLVARPCDGAFVTGVDRAGRQLPRRAAARRRRRGARPVHDGGRPTTRVTAGVVAHAGDLADADAVRRLLLDLGPRRGLQPGRHQLGGAVVGAARPHRPASPASPRWR